MFVDFSKGRLELFQITWRISEKCGISLVGKENTERGGQIGWDNKDSIVPTCIALWRHASVYLIPTERLLGQVLVIILN